MPQKVNVYTIEELAHAESPGEIFLKINDFTTLHIKCSEDKTVINMPKSDIDLLNGTWITIHHRKIMRL